MHLTKNYNTDGGDRTVIGGTLEFENGAEVKNFPEGGSGGGGVAKNQQTSTATSIAALKNDFNALLEKLKEAGVMEPDTVSVQIGDTVVSCASFADAIVAANGASGATIHLLDDVTVADKCGITADMTIVLDGHCLTHPGGGVALEVTHDATLTIDGTAEGSAFYGRINVGKNSNDNGNVVINGGSYSCSAEQTVLHVNGTCQNSSVTITGAEITSPSDNGIQLSAAGEYAITDCSISGKTGIYLKAGSLTLKDSVVQSTAPEHTDYEFNGNGSNPTGDAIVVDSCAYPGGIPTLNLDTGNAISVVEGSGNTQIGYYEKTPDMEFGNVVAKQDDFTVNAGYAWANGDVEGTYKLIKALQG